MTLEQLDSHIANIEALISQTRIAMIAAPNPDFEADELMNLTHFEDILLLLLRHRGSLQQMRHETYLIEANRRLSSGPARPNSRELASRTPRRSQRKF
jgi:hypothetical protein